MNTSQLLEYFRAQIVDTKQPYLWADEEVFIFENEAQNMFCRLTEGIEDATTTEITVVPMITGDIFAKVSPRILLYRSAILLSTGYPLDIKNHTDITKWTNQAGTVSQMIIGLEKELVRWNYTPRFDDEVNLIVYRLPLVPISGPDQEIEVDELHHASLVDWMMHLAYNKQDTETFDPNGSKNAEGRFREYCKQVKAEQERLKHKPRSILYGGI